METNSGFIYQAAFNGKGGATPLETKAMDTAWKTSEATIWLHLDFEDVTAQAWLNEKSNLSPLTIATLIAKDTRPRVTTLDQGLLICLRGVNCNPNADPEDMVSLRLWITGNRILTLHHHQVAAINDLLSALENNHGPTSSSSFLVNLCNNLTGRIADVVGEIDEQVDALEEEILQKEHSALRTVLAQQRRMIISLRRYVVPQRDALIQLSHESSSWITDIDKLHFRETAERTIRCIEDLDASRDRAAVSQEELNNRLAAHMNQTIYTMSIIATIFLPLGLLTGLLGINVGGIPGAQTSWAFMVVCGLLIIIATILFFIFKRKQVL